MTNKIYYGDNLEVLTAHPDMYDLIYIDPPFNTGHKQSQTQIGTKRSENGDRIGWAGKSYLTTIKSKTSYDDNKDLESYLEQLYEVIGELKNQLSPTGSFFLHLDDRCSHYVKIMCDDIFGYSNFMNEIIWSWDYGARTNRKWPRKHNSIFWYTMNPEKYIFNIDECDRIEYMSPKLVGAEKAERGKTPTDSWWISIEGTNSSYRFGYATEKPYKLIERIIRVHSNVGDKVLDCYAGSGKTGYVAALNNRQFTLIDNNPQSIELMRSVFDSYNVEWNVK